MVTPVASTVEAETSIPDDDDTERLSRRDLLVLKLELLRRRRAVAGPVLSPAGQRATRSTR